MKKNRAIIAVLLAAAMACGLAACGSTASKEASAARAAEPAAETAGEEVQESAPAPEETREESAPEEAAAAVPEESVSAGDVPAHADVLVAYFSATGTTRGVAEMIAAHTGGDLYEILAAEPYTEEDLNYSDKSSRATAEQGDRDLRPEIGSEDISLEGYTTVYLGFPIWWGEEPRILDTFVEKYSFEGMTVIPFCTSGSSGIGQGASNLEALAGTGTWLEGKRFGAGASEAEVQSWIDEGK